METPEVLRYGDGHYRRTIYGLGPYIADYPEQALLACIMQGWCPRYVICVLLICLHGSTPKVYRLASQFRWPWWAKDT